MTNLFTLFQSGNFVAVSDKNDFWQTSVRGEYKYQVLKEEVSEIEAKIQHKITSLGLEELHKQQSLLS